MEQLSKRLMNWASILEEQTRRQAVTTSEMPVIYPHLALTPDAHLGKGATVAASSRRSARSSLPRSASTSDAAADLVSIDHTLRQIVNVKGV